MSFPISVIVPTHIYLLFKSLKLTLKLCRKPVVFKQNFVFELEASVWLYWGLSLKLTLKISNKYLFNVNAEKYLLSFSISVTVTTLV